MNDHRKPTLVMLLFPVFETIELRVEFLSFLKTALVVTEADVRILEYQPRYDKPIWKHTYLREQASKWTGPMALICFAGEDDLTQAKSKIGTFDQFVKEIRPARKVLVMPGKAMEEPFERTFYPWSGNEGTFERPLLVIRASETYPIGVTRETASYIGTSTERRKDTTAFLAVTDGAPRKPRSDDTMTGIPIEEPDTGKVVGLRPSNPDEPSNSDRADEDDRPTLNPPPPAVPFQPKR